MNNTSFFIKYYFKFILCIFFISFFLYSCSKYEPPAPRAQRFIDVNKIKKEGAKEGNTKTALIKAAEKKFLSSNKLDTQKYVYKGDRYSDPFIPLDEERGFGLGTDEVVIPNINSLHLKGILSDDKDKFAIIKGGGITYFLKNNKLYDNRRRLISGITGIIYKDKVIIAASDTSKKELTLRKRK